MTCAACSGIIENETKKLSGVESSVVNFATESAELKVDKQFDLETFHALLKKLGYRAIDPKDRSNQNNNAIFNTDFYKAAAAIILASIVMFYAMVIPNNTIQLVLSTILLLGFALPYVKAVLRFHSNMNTLIGLGVLSSYFYSLYLVLATPHAHP